MVTTVRVLNQNIKPTPKYPLWKKSIFVLLRCHETLMLEWTDSKRLMITDPAGNCVAVMHERKLSQSERADTELIAQGEGEGSCLSFWESMWKDFFFFRAFSTAAELFSKNWEVPEDVLVGDKEDWWSLYSGGYRQLWIDQLCFPLAYWCFIKCFIWKEICYREVQLWKLLLIIHISVLTLECLTIGSNVYFCVLKINKFEIGIFFH